MNSVETYHRALEWIRRNPGIWDRFKRYAQNEAKHERRVSVQWLLEDVRRFDRVDNAGDAVKVNNSFGPVFARQLAADCPDVKPYIALRRSRFDELFGIESDLWGIHGQG